MSHGYSARQFLHEYDDDDDDDDDEGQEDAFHSHGFMLEQMPTSTLQSSLAPQI